MTPEVAFMLWASGVGVSVWLLIGIEKTVRRFNKDSDS